MYWYFSKRGSFDEFPYDFGLAQDWKSVCMFRVYSRQPFEWASHLWDRIEERRKRLKQAAPSLTLRTVAPVSANASPLEGMSEDIALPAPGTSLSPHKEARVSVTSSTSGGMSQDILALGEGRDASVPMYVTALASSGMSADVQPEEERPPVSSKQLTMSALAEVGVISRGYSDNQKMGDSKDIEQLPTMYPEGAKTTASEQTEQPSLVYSHDEIYRYLKVYQAIRQYL